MDESIGFAMKARCSHVDLFVDRSFKADQIN